MSYNEIPNIFMQIDFKKAGNARINVILRRVRVTIDAMETQ